MLIDLVSVPRAIKDAGFTPGDMHIKAWGTYVPAAAGLEFRIVGQEQVLHIPVRLVTETIPDGPSLLKSKVLYNDQLVLVPEEQL